MSKYFLDTEFYEDGQRIWPISLGIVSDDNRELYMEFDTSEHESSWKYEGTWLWDNVVPHLTWTEDQKISTKEGARLLLDFVEEDDSLEFWAHFADYDWIVLCQMFGTMMDLPNHFPMFCMDLQQWWVQLGRPDKSRVRPPKPENLHNALADARWNKAFWEQLKRWRETPL